VLVGSHFVQNAESRILTPGLFMLPEYPFRSNYFDVGGVRMHYLDEGRPDGQAVVMLHGNPTWSYYYRHLVAALGDRYRCIVPDHVGMGLSDKPSDNNYEYQLARRVTDIEALLEHLGIRERAALIVHDWGGMIGMAVAERRVTRFSRFVLLNTAAFRLPPGKSLPWQLSLCRAKGLGSLLVRGMNLFARGTFSQCVAKPLAREIRKAYLSPYDSWDHRLAVLRFVEDIPTSPTHPSNGFVTHVEARLHELSRTPTLIAWGMKDFVFDAAFLAEWLERFSEVELHKFDDAAHLVLEDARDEIIPLVREFLERTE
jgi:pimeloyl-ACP methyl ester carboxylesterase